MDTKQSSDCIFQHPPPRKLLGLGELTFKALCFDMKHHEIMSSAQTRTSCHKEVTNDYTGGKGYLLLLINAKLFFFSDSLLFL